MLLFLNFHIVADQFLHDISNSNGERLSKQALLNDYFVYYRHNAKNGSDFNSLITY